jgi:hypothetical protein
MDSQMPLRTHLTMISPKTSTYWLYLLTHTSSYLPMHLQIVDFNCINYNVKCGYYKGVVTSICSLIQIHDNDKALTPNVGIAIARFFFVAVFYLHFGPFNAKCT